VGVLEATPVVVQVQDGVGEGVRHAGVVQRLVGVGQVEVAFDQRAGQVARDVGPAAQAPGLAGVLAPHVGPALHQRRRLGMGPGLEVHVAIGADRERRDHVLAEVLVLVVTPDQHHVGLEVVEPFAHAAQAGHQRGAVPGGGLRALVVGPLGLHRGRPLARVAGGSRNGRVGQRPAQDAGHLRVGQAQRRVVRDAQSQDLGHRGLLASRRVSRPSQPARAARPHGRPGQRAGRMR
jgi:hypothetical protein